MSLSGFSSHLLRPRLLYAGVAAVCAALIGFGMFLQEVDHLEPCPLCVLQRYAFVIVGAAALLAAALPRLPGRIVATLGIVVAVCGAGVGAWHVWLQFHPPAVSSCGPSLEYLVSNLPLGRALPRIFQGYGDCTAIDWSFLGLTIPGWSLIWLLTMALFLALAQGRR